MSIELTNMYDFRLMSLLLTAVSMVTGMVAGELSAIEKSLQFEAAFQGKLLKENRQIYTINLGLLN